MSGYGAGYGRGRKGRGKGRASGQGGYGGGGGPPPWAGQGRGGWRRSFQGSQPIPKHALPVNGVIRIIATTLDNRGLESTISPMFARSPYITIVDIVDRRISKVNSMQNPYAQALHGVGRMFSQWILSSGATAIIASNIGMNALNMLQQSGIKVHIVPAGTRLMDALKSLGYIE